MEEKVLRNGKDTVFRMIYSDPRELPALYNALNGTEHTEWREIEINPLENAVFMNVKNDVSFVLGMTLSLYEHQSTVNPNMPLRDFLVKNKAEAIEVSIFEYNEEQHPETVRREGYDNGYDSGYDSGAEEALIKNIKSIMKNAGISADKAMELLEVPEEKREAVRGRI